MSHSDFYDTSNSLEEKCLHLANKLILYSKKPCSRVQCIRNINSDLIVHLFGSITNHTIPDLLFCTNKEEEAHNVQAVIDTLSLDLLGISLSHITGEDVVAGNLVAIYNLLEVLEGIALHLNAKKSRTSSRRSSLKRKVCRRKTFIHQIKSKSSNDSSNGISDEKSMDSASTSGSFTLPTGSKLTHSIPESGLKKPTDISVKNHFTHEKYLTSEYPVSSSTASYAPSSKVTDIEESKGFQSRHENDGNNQPTYSKQVQLQSGSQASSKTETKPHFQIEKVEQDRPLMEHKGISFVPRHLKEKISKQPHEKTPQQLRKKEQVEELFERNLGNKVKILLEKKSPCHSHASRLKRLQLQRLQKPVRKTPFTPCRKSFLLPHSLRPASKRKASLKKTVDHNDHVSEILKRHKDLSTEKKNQTGFIQELLEEFPGLQLPPQIINHIRKKYQQHLLKLHKEVKSCLLRKSKSQLQRELRHNRRYENKIKYHLRDARLQSAKMKQYCDEFQVEMRKKMQKRNFTEELVLQKVFMDALDMQKEQINFLCEEVKEAKENDAKQHLTYLDTLENLYQTQFSMLSEAILTEKKDKQIQAKSQEQVIRSMQKEFQDELKKEIKFMQKVILDCTEDTHFREMDAELYKEKLRKRYM